MVNNESEDKKAMESSVDEKEREFTDEQEEITEEQPQAEHKEAPEMPEHNQQDPVAALEEELAASKDKYLRLYAEFENFRRRTAKERLELTKTANESLLADLLPVVDDFERAMKVFQDNEDAAPMYEGIKLVHNKFMKILEQKGLKSMDIKIGGDFDAEYQEAIAQTPAPEESLKGKIVDVIEQGYFLGEKVLRHAKVVIGS